MNELTEKDNFFNKHENFEEYWALFLHRKKFHEFYKIN